MALSSATLGAFLLVVVILFVFIQHYLDPNNLRTDPQFDSESLPQCWSFSLTPDKFLSYFCYSCDLKAACVLFLVPVGTVGNGTWLVFLPLAPIKTSSAGLLIIAFITVMLSITCLLLLCHLLGFHFYLCKSQASKQDFWQDSLSFISSHSFPLVFSTIVYTVYKGISTYDYVRMQRQKEARNGGTKVGNTNDAKSHNKGPEVRAVICLSL